MSSNWLLLAEGASARAAMLDAFFAAVARGDAEEAYARMSSVFRMLFTLLAFRSYLEQDRSLAGYVCLEVLEERLERQPSDLALLDLASFGDTVPEDNRETERLIEEYLASPHVAVQGMVVFADGRRERFQAAMLLEGTGWRIKGFQFD
ncbi:MAG: hypothetical protein RMM58_05460 [Chloroflexota bacterium]|nr:hypothetical protein [Dehalococcoidia bacterium]MDW8253311.1 hypothetical protein [Chloroflexota bacterium]